MEIALDWVLSESGGILVTENLDFYQGGGRSGIRLILSLIKNYQLLMLARRGRCLVLAVVHTRILFLCKRYHCGMGSFSRHSRSVTEGPY